MNEDLTFTYVGIRKVKRKGMGGVQECLEYSTISKDGELREGGLISLNKRWFKACTGPSDYIGQWVKLESLSYENKYGFADINGRHVLYDEIIAMVDSAVTEIIEREVLTQKELK